MVDNSVTLEHLQQLIPSRKGTITPEIVDIINASQRDAMFQGEPLIQSMISYEQVLKGTKVGVREYINAIRFCAYLMSNNDDGYTEAFKRTFYFRDFVKNRLTVATDSAEYKELTSASSRYRRSRLVVDILTLSQVPLDLMFTGARHKAVGVLEDRMLNAKFDKDKISAAKELLAATKNDDMKVALNIGPSEEVVSMQDHLNRKLNELAMNQKKMLEAGYDVKDVQKVSIDVNNRDVVEGELIE